MPILKENSLTTRNSASFMNHLDGCGVFCDRLIVKQAATKGYLKKPDDIVINSVIKKYVIWGL